MSWLYTGLVEWQNLRAGWVVYVRAILAFEVWIQRYAREVQGKRKNT